jgi:hypothetical protein
LPPPPILRARARGWGHTSQMGGGVTGKGVGWKGGKKEDSDSVVMEVCLHSRILGSLFVPYEHALPACTMPWLVARKFSCL